MTACLYGHAAATGFQNKPVRMQVGLYEVFPSGGAKPVATVPVALDGTWAISDVKPPNGEASWSHYFVQVAADFGQTTADGGAQIAPARIVGPLTIPASGPVAELDVIPVQISALESAAGGELSVDSVEALVFDPATGAPVAQSASVSVTIAGGTTPMPWTTLGGGQQAYFVSFASPPAAPATLTVTTSVGGTPATWTLAGVAPSFTPTLSAPADGSMVAAGSDLTVSWPAQPLADYELVELFTKNAQSQWTPVYYSSQPDAPYVTSETIAKSYLTSGATDLVDVSFANASCPPTAGGCVLSNVSATAQITLQ
jgi:hypothetical protein